MSQMSGGQALVESLKAAGVQHVFGLLGSSTMEAYDALYGDEAITYIGVRDERSGVHMADAYARLLGAPSVFLAGQAGPGATNLVTGLAQAKLAYSPVLTIAGLVSSDHLGRDAFQEVDQQAILTPVTKRTMTVPTVERIPEFIFEALRVANAGRRGPVVVNIPRNLFAGQAEYSIPAFKLNTHISGSPGATTVADLKRLLLRAKSPVIIAGAGVKWGRGAASVLELAERLQIPITASAGHGDVIANDHPLFFGQVGPRGNTVASGLTREADVVLALGTRLGFNTTFYTYGDISRDAKIVQVDVHPESLGRYFPIEMGIVGDAGEVASAVVASLDESESGASGAATRLQIASASRDALWTDRTDDGGSSRSALTAKQVFTELRSVLPRDAIVTLDAGTLCLQATDQLRYYESPALVSPLDFGLIGFSYAAGLGAKLATPTRPVVSLMGDGGFGMMAIEMCTAVQHKIPTIGIVMDNGCWGAEKAYQRDFYDGRYIGSDIISPAYEHMAELCGAKGYLAEKSGELASALQDALKSRKPSLIRVVVDPDEIMSFRRDSFKHRVSK